MRDKGNGQDNGHRDVNMTPLIDVSLVLVVILLLATPLAFETAIAVRSTDASGQVAEKKTKVEDVELEVVSDDEVRVNGELVERRRLALALRPLITRDNPRRVVVRCGDEVSHGVFVFVLDEAKLAGAAEIAVIGE